MVVSLALRSLRRFWLCGLWSLLAWPACSPSRAGITVPKPSFESVGCHADERPSCALLDGGEVGCCVTAPDGSQHRWRCRQKVEIVHSATPLPVPGLGGVAQVAAGLDHLCALLVDGTVHCLGSNAQGRLGIGRYRASEVRQISEGLADQSYVAAGVAGDHTCARLGDGSIACAPAVQRPLSGPECDRIKGRVRCDESTMDPVALCPVWAAPTAVVALASVARIVNNGGGTCALTAAGSVRCWGDSSAGQIGGQRTLYGLPVPTEVPLPRPAVQLSATHRGGCIVLQDATLHCWDKRFSSQEPKPPVKRADYVAEVQGDAQHGCARKVTGAVECWGWQWTIADPATRGKMQHYQVAGIDAASAISVGEVFGCALQRGEVWCWGRNDKGQLGDGTLTDRMTPGRVPGLGVVVQISSGGDSTCALDAQGAVLCWGWLRDPAGDGRKRHKVPEPTPIAGLGEGVRAVTVGTPSCAVMADRTVRCWGLQIPGAERQTAAVAGRAPRGVGPPAPPRLEPPPPPPCDKAAAATARLRQPCAVVEP